MTHPAKKFIHALTGNPEGEVTTVVLPDSDRCRVQPRAFYGTLDHAHRTLHRLNKQGAGVFVTVNETTGTARADSDIMRIRALFVDGDDAPQPDAWALRPTILHQRSGTRWAAFWVLSDDMPLDLFRGAQKALATALGTDPSVCDLPRLMRLPGYEHCKDLQNRSTYDLVACDPELTYPWQSVLSAYGIDPDALPVDTDSQWEPINLDHEITEQERQALLSALATMPTAPDHRHRSMVRWVIDALAAGMPQDEVHDLAHHYMVSSGVERDCQREVANAIRTGHKRIKEGRAKITTPGIRPDADFAPRAAAATLSPEEAEDQADALGVTASLALTQHNEIKNIEANWVNLLRTHEALKGLVVFNGFTMQQELSRNPPWSRRDTQSRQWQDRDDIKLLAYIQSEIEGGQLVTKTKLVDAVSAVASDTVRHPVREYLNGLKWDGVPRIDMMLCTYWGAEDTPYTRAVSKNTMIAAVRRVRRPGCKVDTVLILEGKQGSLKSSSLKALLPTEDWLTDARIDPANKDTAMTLRGKWLVEMGEMQTMKKAEVADLKAWLVRQEDRQRDAYGRHITAVPRQCIFIGTTNEDAYLKDETGARRFWPVYCHAERIDVEGIARDRDQLWAEAAHREAQNEQHWLTYDEELMQQEEASRRSSEDPWMWAIAEYVDSKADFDRVDGNPLQMVEVTNLAQMVFDIAPKDADKLVVARISTCLRALGWRKSRRMVDGQRRTVWERELD